MKIAVPKSPPSFSTSKYKSHIRSRSHQGLTSAQSMLLATDNVRSRGRSDEVELVGYNCSTRCA